MGIKADGIPKPIEYNNWTIWCWTGWKGEKGIADHPMGECFACGQPIEVGQALHFSQATPYRHWTCVYPDNRLDRLMGQWLAVKGEKPNERFMEVHVDNLVVACIDGGAYKRGDSFLVSTEGEFITEHTPDAQREIAKKIGFERLKYLIDQVEAHEVEADG